MVYETKVDVRLPDCDSMRIVHHAVYPIWYEIARIDFFEKCGYGYSYARAREVDPAMVHLEINYGAPVTFPGTVTVKTRVTLCEGKKLGFTYELWAEGANKPNSTASSFHIWVKDGKSCDLEHEFPEMFAAYHAALAD